MAFRGLLTSAMQQDTQARQASSLSQSLPIALQQIEKGRTSRREEGVAGRNVARSALYQKRPEMAAEALGIDYKPAAAPDVSDLDRSKVTVDESGNVNTTYETPPILDAQFFAKEYNKYTIKIDELNSNRELLDKPTVPKPSFKDWMGINFPDYAQEVLSRSTDVTTSDKGKREDNTEVDQWLADNDYEVNDINRKLIKEANPGVF